VTGVVQAPNSELVQVNYKQDCSGVDGRVAGQPEIRNLLLVGDKSCGRLLGADEGVSLLTDECKAGHECQSTADGNGIRHALMVSLRYDEDAGVRMKAAGRSARFCRSGPNMCAMRSWRR